MEMMMTTERRALFSAIEVTLSDGTKQIELDWHRDLYPVLDELSPNGEITDKIVDIAEELIRAFDEEDAET
jgi:hypothetical protein